jgi:predicted PurR-regulated permease PerM
MPGSLVAPRGLLTAIVVVIGLLLLWQVWPTVVIAAAALMFASALSPWADALERRGLGRGAAVLLISAVFAGLVVVFVVALTPVLVQQTRTLVEDLPGVRAQAVAFLRERHAQRAAEQPSVLELIITLQTARALNLAIPPAVLAQATEVIQ